MCEKTILCVWTEELCVKTVTINTKTKHARQSHLEHTTDDENDKHSLITHKGKHGELNNEQVQLITNHGDKQGENRTEK